MDVQAASLIGAGLAAIGAGMAAIGVGNVFGSFLESALRNPAAADGQQGRLFIGFAAAALLGLHSFLIQIGSASCRGSGGQCRLIPVGAVSLKKKIIQTKET